MAKKVKQTGKNTLILLMICVVVFMAYIVYKTFGNQIVELFHLLEHGDQEELKATISKLTPEQLAAVKAQIESMQAEAAKEKEEASEAAEEPVEEAALEAPVEAETVTEEAGSEEPAAE